MSFYPANLISLVSIFRRRSSFAFSRFTDSKVSRFPHVTVIALLAFQDAERVVSKQEGIAFARQYGCLFLECSAKTRANVQLCFEELVQKVCLFFPHFF